MTKLEPLFCRVGDIVEFIKPVTPTGWPGESTLAVSVGDRYRVINLVGSGWDLERLDGDGPTVLRLLNSQMKEFVRISA